MHGVCFPVNSVDRANEEKNPKIKKTGEKDELLQMDMQI